MTPEEEIAELRRRLHEAEDRWQRLHHALAAAPRPNDYKAPASWTWFCRVRWEALHGHPNDRALERYFKEREYWAQPPERRVRQGW